MKHPAEPSKTAAILPNILNVGGEGEIDVRSHLRRTAKGGINIVKRHTRAGREEQARVEEHKGKQRSELDLWREWKDSGEDPAKLAPLLNSLDPFIKSRARIHLGRVRMIPDSAILAEYRIQAVSALRTFDPSRGVLLSTHVGNHLQKAKRFVAANQNAARIPENRIYKIQEYTVARDELSADLGRTPTDAELADKLNWREAEVARMDSELRNDLVTQSFEIDPSVLMPSKEEEIMRLFVHELDGEEEEVYRHTIGLGRPQLGTGEIADKLGMQNYQVSRIKERLARRLQKYLEEI